METQWVKEGSPSFQKWKKMFKYLALLGLASLLMACAPQDPQQVTYILPPELSDCKIYKIDSKSSPVLYVVRCTGEKPAETSVQFRLTGKTSQTYHTILIDGVEYKAVEK